MIICEIIVHLLVIVQSNKINKTRVDKSSRKVHDVFVRFCNETFELLEGFSYVSNFTKILPAEAELINVSKLTGGFRD